MIIVACNTATSSAISYLREHYEIPFVGMEPAIKPAAKLSKTGSVGILATAGTLNGELYKQTQQRYANHVQVHLQIGTGLVDLVEQNKLESPETEALLRQYIQPMLDENIDHLVLGCSHYPFLKPVIQRIAEGKEVNLGKEGNQKNEYRRQLKIIEPSKAVAQQTKRVLKLNGLLSQSDEIGATQFYSTGNTTQMEQFLRDVVKESTVVKQGVLAN